MKTTRALVFDIEANGLLDTVSELYVFVGRELNTNSVVQYVGMKDIQDNLPNYLSSFTTLIGHNIIGYDIPLLAKFIGIYEVYHTHVIQDTLVMSRLLFPDRVGGHSIEAWAKRFGMEKTEQESWDVFDPNMVERCHNDVNITQRVYNRLMQEMMK
jgi:DNA polymerase III epsilon subunit-like protein